MATQPTTGHPISTIASLLDLTERRVQQLSAEGVIPRASHGRYEIVGAVRGYVRYLRQRAIQGGGEGNDTDASRVALMKARARKATLEADQAENQLLPRAEVEKTWTAIVSNIRMRLLAVPTASAQAIIYLKSTGEIAAQLTAAISEALDDLSNTPVYVAAANRGNDAEFGADGARSAPGSETTEDGDGLGLGEREEDSELGGLGGAGALEHQ